MLSSLMPLHLLLLSLSLCLSLLSLSLSLSLAWCVRMKGEKMNSPLFAFMFDEASSTLKFDFDQTNLISFDRDVAACLKCMLNLTYSHV